MSKDTPNVLDKTSILEESAQPVFKEDQHGFLKQQNPQPYTYSVEYKQKQSTNSNMAWLRLGWLASQLPVNLLNTFSCVDIGSGNGAFIKEGQSVFKTIVPYDLCGESIEEADLYDTNWDMIVLSDVLEHYPNIDDFWTLPFKYAMVSFPETPRTGMNLSKWRHYKPDEHIYMLDSVNFVKWVQSHGAHIVAQGFPEDLIRKRWNSELPNISTFLIKR